MMKYKELIRLNDELKAKIDELNKQIQALQHQIGDDVNRDYIIKTEDNKYELISRNDIEFIKDGLEIKKEVIDVLKD